MSKIVAIRPGGRLLPVGFQTSAAEIIDEVVATVERRLPAEAAERPIKVAVEDVVEIIDLIESTMEFEDGYSFDWKAFAAAFEYFSRTSAPDSCKGQAWLHVATGRKMSRSRPGGRFSDAPQSPGEVSIARAHATALPFCLLLRQEGLKEDGWRGSPFWWPMLFAPNTAVATVFATSPKSWLQNPSPSLAPVQRFQKDVRIPPAASSEPATSRPGADEQRPTFEMNSVGIHATGRESVDGFMVLAGSTARRELKEGFPQGYRSFRNQLISDGKLAEGPEPEHYRFATDVMFPSPTAAAAVVLARNASGPQEWKLRGTGQTYKVWRAANLTEPREVGAQIGAPQ